LKRFKVSEVAKTFGLSTTAIYKHLKRFQTRLKEHVSKEGGVTLVSEDGVNILRESITTSTVSSREVTPAPVLVPVQDNRLEGIEKALLAMADQMKIIVDQNNALRLEVSTLQKALVFNKP
jgi:transposase-like protein